MNKNFIITGFADEIDPMMQKQYPLLKKLGINYIELRGVNGENISKLTIEQVIDLKKELDENGFKISAIGSPIGKIKITDPFDEHFENFKKIVEFAKILETPYIRMFSFYTDTPEADKAEVYARLKQFIDYAKKEGVILLHENEKHIYGDNIERTAELMQGLYCDNFKCTFDFANYVQCGCDTLKAYAALKPYIEYIHIKDSFFEDGRIVPAGMGEGNIQEILKDVFENGYNGFLSLEPHLFHFKGLDDLEPEKIAEREMTSGEAAFSLAYDSLMSLIERI